jgi:hypothetical protein
MDEQFRMLGHERRADLDREARRFALADQARRGGRPPESPLLRVRWAVSIVSGLAHKHVVREVPSS